MPLTARALLHGKVGLYWQKSIEGHLETRNAYGALESLIATIRCTQCALEAIPRAGKMVCVHEVHELADLILRLILPLEAAAMQGATLIEDAHKVFAAKTGQAVELTEPFKRLKRVRNEYKQCLCDAFDAFRIVRRLWAHQAMVHVLLRVEHALQGEGMLVEDNVPKRFNILDIVDMFFDTRVMAYFACRPTINVPTIEVPASSDLSGHAVDTQTAAFLESIHPRRGVFYDQKFCIDQWAVLTENIVAAMSSVSKQFKVEHGQRSPDSLGSLRTYPAVETVRVLCLSGEAKALAETHAKHIDACVHAEYKTAVFAGHAVVGIVVDLIVKGMVAELSMTDIQRATAYIHTMCGLPHQRGR